MPEKTSYRSFVSYIDRSREYYAAHGYERPYAWAHYEEVPFSEFRKALSEMRVGLVTTAGQALPEGMASEPEYMRRSAYAQPASPPPRQLYTDDLFWDKKETHTEDIDSFLPVNRLAEIAKSGRIGSVAPRFYGVPTDYSQSNTIHKDAPQILAWYREDKVDAVLLSAL